MYYAVSKVSLLVRGFNIGILTRLIFPGFKLTNESAFARLEPWIFFSHPNVVAVKEAFTTKQFGDYCLLLLC